MTAPALSIRLDAPTLEELRESWRADLGRQKHGRRELARTTWPLYLHWSTVHRTTNRRQFMAWLTGTSDPPTNLYAYLSAGFALSSGLDFDLPVSDLDRLGQALSSGHTPDDLRALLETGGMEAVRALVTTERKEGHVTLPTSELPAVREAVQRVSDSESLSAPQALALIVQGHAAMSPEMQAAVLTAARTGQRIEDGAREALDAHLDFRGRLSARACFVPSCMAPTAHLHHFRRPNTRFRTQELIAGLCLMHHEAEPGLSSEAVHAATQTDWVLRHWPDEGAFWSDLALLYSELLFQP